MVYKSLDKICITDIVNVQGGGISSETATQLHNKLVEIIKEYGPATPQTWKQISTRILNPDLPFSFHQMMYYGCYLDFGPDPPAWLPDPDDAKLTNIGSLLERRGKDFLGPDYKDPISSYSDFHEFSVSNLQVFWKTILDEMHISFSVPPERILVDDPSEESQLLHPGGQWLPGAYVNPARNCLSLGGKRNLSDIAVIWRDEGKDEMPVNRMTFEKLRSEVWLVAYALGTLGLEIGSAIAIDMPMDVNSVVIYLAIVLAGYVVVSIADSFASNEISTRLKISKAKAIFTQELIIRGGRSLPLYSRVVDAQSPLAIVIPTRGSSFSMKLRDGDISWHDFLEKAKSYKNLEFVGIERPIEAFTNILFSSGTTGEPKAIPWTLATPFKAGSDGWCHMDVHKGDVVAWPTNLGWMMGPWLIYASLLNGGSLALYNGSPLGPGFAKFVQDAKVTMLGVIPSIVRAWKSKNSTAGFDWSTIRSFGSTGEASSVDECLWLMGRAHYKPVIEYCGGTEIGGGFITGSLLQPQCLSAFSTPNLGCNLFILDKDGSPLPPKVPGFGELALNPLMFGASNTLLNANHYGVYFKGMPSWKGKVLRRHGDVFELTSKGYYRAHGRADDTMNLGGIKVSSVEIERVCNSVDDMILETAAIGATPAGGGPERLVIAVVFKDPNGLKPDLNKLKGSLNLALQKNLNPLFKVSDVVPFGSLPRTATNKVMRRVLRQQLTQKREYSKL
uniref:probable acyl-activating enzyme 17, peroxisomal n=1 Tax=Erigeron canadensis TaxID=72917 RepID=UPI001CB8D2E7|nr:probable acyl-activating enzyme 17, peroxisomal [Erigeron canadensis]